MIHQLVSCELCAGAGVLQQWSLMVGWWVVLCQSCGRWSSPQPTIAEAQTAWDAANSTRYRTRGSD